MNYKDRPAGLRHAGLDAFDALTGVTQQMNRSCQAGTLAYLISAVCRKRLTYFLSRTKTSIRGVDCQSD